MRMHPYATSCRRGVAPLELVVALPLLMLLAALIVNAAAGGVAVGEATVAARTEAFRVARANHSGDITRFVFDETLTAQDVVSASAQKQEKVPPALGTSTLTGNAQLAVLQNTWDARELNLNQPVNLTFIGQAAAAGGAGEVLSALNSFQEIARTVENLFGNLDSLIEQLSGTPNALSQLDGLLEQAKQELEAKVGEFQGKLDEAKGKLAGVVSDIEKTKKMLEDARRDLKDKPEDLKKREEELNKELDRLGGERKKAEDAVQGAQFDVDTFKKAGP